MEIEFTERFGGEISLVFHLVTLFFQSSAIRLLISETKICLKTLA
jgi:hypothetical protein